MRSTVSLLFEVLHTTWEEVRLITDEIRDLGESVVRLGQIEGRGRGSGVPVDAPMGAVFDFRGGKVWRARSYLAHGQALKAVGLSE